MRDITLCHPRLQELAAKLVEECQEQGLKIKIGETLRTVEEQEALYAQGRTKPGNIVTNARGTSYSSQHQWGIAFDFYRNDGQGAYNESGDFFGRVGAIGKSLGLGWGGDWKSIVDKPHLYLPDWGSTTYQLRAEYKTPDNFMATWGPKMVEGWKQASDGVRWWYQTEDGGYCKDGWHWLREETGGTWGWYLFDADGYMLTGYQTAPDGRRFFLCPDAGIHQGKCMVTDDQGALQVAEYDQQKKAYKK